MRVTPEFKVKYYLPDNTNADALREIILNICTEFQLRQVKDIIGDLPRKDKQALFNKLENKIEARTKIK